MPHPISHGRSAGITAGVTTALRPIAKPANTPAIGSTANARAVPMRCEANGQAARGVVGDPERVHDRRDDDRAEDTALSSWVVLLRFISNLRAPGWTQLTAAFTLRLSEATLEALDRLAEKTERSRSWLATKAIEDYIALNAWQIGKIEAGIAAADRGDFASDNDVARVVGKYSAKG